MHTHNMVRFLAPMALLGVVAYANGQEHYRITVDSKVDIDQLFVQAHEWNRETFDWEYLPIYLGSVKADEAATFDLGEHVVDGWAVYGHYAAQGLVFGINPELPDSPLGKSFETVFPGYNEEVVHEDISHLITDFEEGVPNYDPIRLDNMSEFLHWNYNTLKSSSDTGSLNLVHFSDGVDSGVARISTVPEPTTMVVFGVGVVGLMRRRR